MISKLGEVPVSVVDEFVSPNMADDDRLPRYSFLQIFQSRVLQDSNGMSLQLTLPLLFNNDTQSSCLVHDVCTQYSIALSYLLASSILLESLIHLARGKLDPM